MAITHTSQESVDLLRLKQMPSGKQIARPVWARLAHVST
jgi:hypothetical protein